MVEHTVPTLDEAALTSLHSALDDDFSEVVSLYLAQTPELLEAVRYSYDAQAYEQARQAVHTIKGSSSNLGAKRLVMLAQQLEDELKSTTAAFESFSSDYEQLLMEYSSVEKMIRAYCQRCNISF